MVLAALLVGRRLELSRREASALALLAALTAWTALSALWSWSAPLSLHDAHRQLVYLAALAALLLVATRASAPWLAGGVLAGAAGLSLANLAHRTGDLAPGPGGEALPLGYANAAGLVGALAVLLAAGLARELPGAARLAVAAVGIPGAAALALAGSRGAWLALLVGLAAGAALLRGPAAAYPAVAALGVGGAHAAAWLRGSERERYWTVALGQAESAPLHGTGAGTFARAWLLERPLPLGARDAHGLFVETAAELGVVGLALLLGLLALPLAGAVAARGASGVAAAGAAYAAFLTAAAVDWHWELPAVTLTGLACGVALLAASRVADVALDGRRRAAAGAAALAVGAVAFAGLVGHSALAEAEESLRRGDAVAAGRLAERAARFLPWAAEPHRIEGEARLFEGRPAAARASFRRALERDDRDPETWRGLARASDGEERRAAERRAALLDPVGVP